LKENVAYSGKRPPLSSVIPTGQWVQYKGPDLRGRNKDTPQPRSLCDPVSKYVTYILSLDPAFLPKGRWGKLQEKKTLDAWKESGYRGPAKPVNENGISEARAKTLLTLLPPMQLQGPETPKTVQADGSVTLNQMKCYRLDSKRDIKGDRVYLGGKGVPKPDTLKQELDRAARGDIDEEQEPAIKPGHIAVASGVIFGILIGVIALATIAYFVMGKTFSNYLDVVNNLYASATKPAKSMALPIDSWLSGPMNKLCGVKTTP
jgi:hypothetical protein